MLLLLLNAFILTFARSIHKYDNFIYYKSEHTYPNRLLIDSRRKKYGKSCKWTSF